MSKTPRDTTNPGFSRVPPPRELPGFDPSNSPLSRGGERDSAQPTPADSALRGLESPQDAERPRVMFRVRREGWVSRRAQARSRFSGVVRESSASNRVLDGLRSRGGLLERSRKRARRGRLNLRKTR